MREGAREGDRVIHPVAALVLVILMVLFAFWIVIESENTSPAAAAPTQQVAQVDPVRSVQERLATFGYTVAVDGVYGPQTTRAVRHFQKVNGLVADGIAGPITSAALGINTTATATATAVRGTQTQITAPVDAGTWARCPQWEATADYFGLPDQFDAIMWRESNCRPDVTSSTGCCRGLLQLHRVHLPKPECQAYTASDLFDPAINLCVASILYKTSGMSPWRL